MDLIIMKMRVHSIFSIDENKSYPSHNVEGLLDFRYRCPYPNTISSTNNILDNALNSFMSSKKAIGKLRRDSGVPTIFWIML